MAQVIRPQPRDSGFKELLALGGGVAGGVIGGSAGGVGAVPGAAAGVGIGQTAGSILDPNKPQQENPQAGGQASAMARRQAQMSQDNLATLKQAEASLPSLPEELRQQYAPAIIRARMMEQQARGI